MVPGASLAARPGPEDFSAKEAAANLHAQWPFPPSGLSGAALAETRAQGATSWINSKPLFTPAQGPAGRRGVVSLDPSLKGKLVLLSFWDYTNTNALRMVPYLSAWHDRYGKEGLVIVGVHSPEFPFTAQHRNVARAVKRLGLTYPVYLDSDFLIWRLFENQHWPRTILIGPGGRWILDRIGYANTGEIESAIRNALGKGQGKANAAPILPPPLEERPGASCYPATETTYAGYSRGRLGAPGYDEEGAAVAYQIPRHAEVRQEAVIYLEGRWRATAQTLFPAGDGPWEIRVKFQGTGVKAVIAPAASEVSARLRVTLDEEPVPAAYRGSDLRPGPGNETHVFLSEPRLAEVITHLPAGAHELAIFPETAGTGISVFYFERCELPTQK